MSFLNLCWTPFSISIAIKQRPHKLPATSFGVCKTTWNFTPSAISRKAFIFTCIFFALILIIPRHSKASPGCTKPIFLPLSPFCLVFPELWQHPSCWMLPFVSLSEHRIVQVGTTKLPRQIASVPSGIYSNYVSVLKADSKSTLL